MSGIDLVRCKHPDGKSFDYFGMRMNIADDPRKEDIIIPTTELKRFVYKYNHTYKDKV